MAWYLVEIRYVQEKLADVRPRHREFLARHAERGDVAVAGPLGDGSGGMVLFEAEDEQALRTIIDQDPYYTEGVVAHRTIREWKPIIGSWVPNGS
jgi:uncharacterized protein YciI